MRLLQTVKNRTGLRRFQRGIWVAMGVQAIRSTGFSISFTYLPLYLYQERNISMTSVGLIIMISGILSGFCQILGGMLADRFGDRKMFIVFQSAETTLFALLAVLVATHSVVWSILLTSVTVTIMGGMSAPAVSAIVADVSEKDHLTESYGLMAIGGNLGWAIGPLAGGFLQSASYAWAFGVGAFITSFSLIGIPYLPKDIPRKPVEILSKKNLEVFFSDSTMVFFCVLCTLFYLEISNWGSTLSVFTVDRIGFSPAEYGLLMSISGVLIIIFQYPVSRGIERLGYPTALFLGSFLYGAGFLSLAWVKSFVPAVGSVVILVLGEMLFIPTSYSVMGKISKPEDRAKSMGLLGLYATVGSSFGPLLGGFLLDRFPTNPLYLWGPLALPAFVAAIGFISWRKYARPEAAREVAVGKETAARR